MPPHSPYLFLDLESQSHSTDQGNSETELCQVWVEMVREVAIPQYRSGQFRERPFQPLDSTPLHGPVFPTSLAEDLTGGSRGRADSHKSWEINEIGPVPTGLPKWRLGLGMILVRHDVCPVRLSKSGTAGEIIQERYACGVRYRPPRPRPGINAMSLHTSSPGLSGLHPRRGSEPSRAHCRDAHGEPRGASPGEARTIRPARSRIEGQGSRRKTFWMARSCPPRRRPTGFPVGVSTVGARWRGLTFLDHLCVMTWHKCPG